MNYVVLISDILTPKKRQICSFFISCPTGALRDTCDVSGPLTSIVPQHPKTEGPWIPIATRDAWMGCTLVDHIF